MSNDNSEQQPTSDNTTSSQQTVERPQMVYIQDSVDLTKISYGTVINEQKRIR